MLDISKSERFFILTILIISVFLTAFLYYKKTSSSFEIKRIEFREKQVLVNINKAARTQLERLPGIGPALAERIIFYRQQIGWFKTKHELKNVKGIGEKKFEKLKDLISISE